MKNVKTLLLLIIIFIIAAFFSVGYSVFTATTSFLTIKHGYSEDALITKKTEELLSGDKATGEFKARDNFLGIIEIRFLTYGKESRDSVIFRLKEKSSKEWYYVNTYKAKEFGGYPLFPFGFPIVNDSKGKQYYFELESLYGKPGRAVGIRTVEPVIVAKHKFNLSYLLEDKKELVGFSFKKIKEIIQETNAAYHFAVLYLILISPMLLKKAFRKVHKKRFFNRLQNKSEKETHTALQLTIKLQTITLSIFNFFGLIFAFILTKLYSFHRWLGEE